MLKKHKVIIVVIFMFMFVSSILAQSIQEAAQKGDLETVKMLLEKNPELINDNSGTGKRTPLHCAIMGKQNDIVRFLLTQHADINIKDARGTSPLNYASSLGLKDIVMLLIENGVDVKNDKDNTGGTPFLHAVFQENYEIAKILIMNGSNVNAKGYMDITPLHLALSRGHKKLIKLLLENGADVNSQEKTEGVTPLHLALTRLDEEIIRLLLAQGADVNIRNKAGKTALQVAVEYGNAKNVELILDNITDINEKDHYGLTPLHRAAITGHLNATALLIARGADVNARDTGDKTPLYYAGKYGNKQVADLLIERGGESDEVAENYGDSPLLKQELKEKEAFIWYLGQSGWAVKTTGKLLIFDYCEQSAVPNEPLLANGHINPMEIKNLDVYVFSSHVHKDHFDKVILDWQKNIENIQYFFGWKDSTIAQYNCMEGREKKEIDGMEIYAVDSKEAGPLEGAFLVKVDGLSIYHPGDYCRIHDIYKKDIESLIGITDEIDVIFLPINIIYINAAKYTIEKTQPKVMFPMHAEGNEYLYREFEQMMKKEGINSLIGCADHRGDCFIFSNGKIKKK